MVRLDLSAEAERPVSFASDMIKFYNFLDEYLVGYGICLGACIMLAGVLVFLHLQTWTKPDEQKKILVIICIPPAIGLLSFVALQLNEDDDSSKTLFLLLDCLKDCLAGLCIAMFMSLWLASMKYDKTKSSEQDFLHNFTGSLVENYFPLTLILPRKIIANQYYPKFLKYCTWQFLPIRLVCSFLMIFLQLHDMYPIWLSWAFFLIMNVSVTLAFFTVFAFFRAFMLEFPQYMLVAWVFHFILISGFCFLQGGILKVLEAMGIIKSNRIHDNLVAYEMVHFSLIQCLAFSPGLYRVSQSSPQMKSTISAAIAQLELGEFKKK